MHGDGERSGPLPSIGIQISKGIEPLKDICTYVYVMVVLYSSYEGKKNYLIPSSGCLYSYQVKLVDLSSLHLL